MLIRIQSDITLRQVNICSNTVFTVLVLFSPSQASCFDGASSLALSIAFVNFAGYGFFTFLNMGELKWKFEDDVKKTIKFVTILISSGFLLVYVMAVDHKNKPIDTAPACAPI